MTDVIIVGGGPSGLSTAIYAKRAGLSVLILDKGAADCQLAKAAEVENYLGFPSINGLELYSKFTQHAKEQQITILKKSVVSVEKTKAGFKIHTKKDEYECRYLVLAMGRSHKHLNVKGEDKFIGVGVSYCATCDGFFFKNKKVCVVGGGDSALSQAIYLSSICEKVYVLHRRDTFRAANYLVERAASISNIEFIYNANILEVLGETSVSGVCVTVNAHQKVIDCEGVFGAIGEKSNLSFSIQGLNVTQNGQIITDSLCKTNIENLFAVGDIREREVYQIITAVADGALAVEGIIKAHK